MSAPVAVNTADGTCWTRRGALRGGEALYAPEGVCSCPEFVMATLSELAELGIVGSADALPMPTGPAPQPRTVLDRARDALNARMGKDDLRLVLGNVIDYATELERQRNVFRDQRNNVFATNEQLLAKVEESGQARLRAENDARTLTQQVAELEARLAEYERPADEDPIVYTLTSEAVPHAVPAEDVAPQVAKLRAILAGQREQAADEGLSGPCDCGEGAVHYTATDCPAAQRAAETGGAE